MTRKALTSGTSNEALLDDFSYRKLGNVYLLNLSIIDLLMFMELAEIQKRLHRYSLIDNFDSGIDFTGTRQKVNFPGTG